MDIIECDHCRGLLPGMQCYGCGQIKTQAGADYEAGRLALDVSLEQARALHRVWRALNDGDCPKCHEAQAATDIVRGPVGDLRCPNCGFIVTGEEIREIERLFAPAMDAAISIFEAWRASGPGPTFPPKGYREIGGTEKIKRGDIFFGSSPPSDPPRFHLALSEGYRPNDGIEPYRYFRKLDADGRDSK